MTKIGGGGFRTTLILALLLVIVSVGAGAGLVYLIWNPTGPDQPTVVQGILDKAQDNAKTSISTLVTSLGYDKVRFT